MQIIQTQVNIASNRKLNLQLPEDVEAGEYHIVVVMNPRTEVGQISSQHNLNRLAGKIKAFNNIDAVAWQHEIRKEWDETRLSP